MRTLIKLTKVGDDAAIALPDEMLERLGVGLGDILYASVTPDGIELSVSNPDAAAPLPPPASQT